MVPRTTLQVWLISIVPLGIAALSGLGALGVNIPNQPGVLLLAVAYCAYRGGVAIGLTGAVFHMAYSAVFFSNPQQFLSYTNDNLARALVIALVAPAMGLMVGVLRRSADRLVAREQAIEAKLVKLNAELEQRVVDRTAELEQARNLADAAQAQARLSEARFRDFATAASDWFWEQDENLRFSYFSPEAFNGSNAAAERNLGKTRREVGTAILSEAEWQAHEAELAARRPFRNLVTKRLAADGTIRYTSTSGQPYFDEHGKFLGYRGTARNVTQEMLSEMELERRVAEGTAEVRALQQKIVEQERRATLDQLTATVSHELRNPLSAIRNSVYLITHAAHTSNLALDRPLDRINRSLARCENIIAQLVEYSQIRAPQRRGVIVDKLLTELLDAQTVPDGIALIRELDAPAPSVSCDPEHLRRAVLSVIENAAQALERARSNEQEGGREAGAAPVGHVDRIWVRSRVESGRIAIEIADNGPGIAAEIMPRIFEPLFSTKAFGVGLGLSLVKQILDFHGGGIEVTSEPGQGARVILWLPLAQADEIAA